MHNLADNSSHRKGTHSKKEAKLSRRQKIQRRQLKKRQVYIADLSLRCLSLVLCSRIRQDTPWRMKTTSSARYQVSVSSIPENSPLTSGSTKPSLSFLPTQIGRSHQVLPLRAILRQQLALFPPEYTCLAVLSLKERHHSKCQQRG